MVQTSFGKEICRPSRLLETSKVQVWKEICRPLRLLETSKVQVWKEICMPLRLLETLLAFEET
jgi:hypothetical protein